MPSFRATNRNASSSCSIGSFGFAIFSVSLAIPVRRSDHHPTGQGRTHESCAIERQGVRAALTELRRQNGSTEFVCGGRSEPRKWFGPCLTAAGIKGFTWHCLRHTFASRLVMSGADVRTVAELLRDRTLAMVMRYAHLAPDYRMEPFNGCRPSSPRVVGRRPDPALNPALPIVRVASRFTSKSFV
jgi:hypothetical protein